MRRTEQLGARALAVVGLVATLCYLIWRVGFSMHDTELWLSLPTLLVEVVGFLGAVALTWALWPLPARYRAGGGATVATVAEAVDVVLRVDRQSAHEVRATLLALQSVQHVNGVVLVDLSARPVLAALATEFQAVYAATDTADHNGLRVMLAAVSTSQFLLLDAGDIPTGDIVERLIADFADSRVAVVQGLGVSLAEDSAEHGPNGRHELLFERNALNPALGCRGSAAWLGTGSMVRIDALRDLHFDTTSALEAHWLAGTALLAAGWRVTAPGDVPVVAQRVAESEQAVSEDRLQRARAARHMVFGSAGVLRSRSFTPTQRLAVVAWAVRPLSGLRRVVFLVLLGSAILAGEVPFHASATVLAYGWLPAFAYTTLGLALLSGWTLRPGDRTRWSLHSIGAACRSLRSAHDRPVRRAPIIALPSPQYGAGLVIAVVALSFILVLRGVSDRLTHTLGVMPQSSLMALLIVTLWTLGISLDLLQVLARRAQLRRTARVVSSLPATLGERAVSIVDLTALGAGLISQTGVDVNERLLLDSTIPTRSGVTTMHVPCIVRNVSRRADGDFRIGVEFGDVNDATANAFAEFCTIEPAWERLGALPSSRPVSAQLLTYLDEPETEPTTGRMAVRLVSLLALVGAVASSAPATVDASAPLNHRVSGVVVAVAKPALDPTTGLPIDATTSAPDPPDDATTSAPDPMASATTVPDTIVVDTSVFTTVVETTLELNISTTTVASQASIGEPAPVPGAVVVAVCSTDAGLDGSWGTHDDAYGATVSAITNSDGTYQLELVGEACWATVAPPNLLTDSAGGEVVLAALDVSGPSISGRRVLVERTLVAPTEAPTIGSPQQPLADGASLRLLDASGRTVGSVKGDVVRGFKFATADGGALPTPVTSQLATTTVRDRSTLSIFVLAIAAVLALSIVLGLARPRAARAKPSRGA